MASSLDTGAERPNQDGARRGSLAVWAPQWMRKMSTKSEDTHGSRAGSTGSDEGVDDERAMLARKMQGLMNLGGAGASLHRLMFDPDTRPMRAWAFVQGVVQLAHWVLVPMRVGFGVGGEGGATGAALAGLEAFFDVLLWLDIALRFRTSALVLGHKVDDPRVVGFKYLRKWFALDLLSALPLDRLLVLAAARGGAASWASAEVAALARAPRLLRVRVLAHLDHAAPVLGLRDHLLRIVHLALLTLMLFHLGACGWYRTSRASGFGATGWAAPAEMLGHSFERRYFQCIYWSVGMMTGLVSGEFPERMHEHAFSLATMTAGVFIYGSVIASVSALVAEGAGPQLAFRGRVVRTQRMLRTQRDARALEARSLSYFDFLWSSQRGASGVEALRFLPENLRIDILMALSSETLRPVPWLANTDEGFERSFASRMKLGLYMPAEAVDERVAATAPPRGIFFIHRGCVQVRVRGIVLRDMGRGDHFGIVVALGALHAEAASSRSDKKAPGQASRRALERAAREPIAHIAVTQAEIFELSLDDFNFLMRAFPRVRAKAMTFAVARAQEYAQQAREARATRRAIEFAHELLRRSRQTRSLHASSASSLGSAASSYVGKGGGDEPRGVLECLEEGRLAELPAGYPVPMAPRTHPLASPDEFSSELRASVQPRVKPHAAEAGPGPLASAAAPPPGALAKHRRASLTGLPAVGDHEVSATLGQLRRASRQHQRPPRHVRSAAAEPTSLCEANTSARGAGRLAGLAGKKAYSRPLHLAQSDMLEWVALAGDATSSTRSAFYTAGGFVISDASGIVLVPISLPWLRRVLSTLRSGTRWLSARLGRGSGSTALVAPTSAAAAAEAHKAWLLASGKDVEVLWPIVLPRSRAHRVWVSALCALLAYHVMTTPFMLGFGDAFSRATSANSSSGAMARFLDLMTFVLLLVDMLAKAFCAAYIDADGLTEVRPLHIARHYWQSGRGKLDLITALPYADILKGAFELAAWAQGTTSTFGAACRVKSFCALRLLRLPVLLRVPQLYHLERERFEGLRGSVLESATHTFARLAAIFLYLTHLCACMYFIVAREGNTCGQGAWSPPADLCDSSVSSWSEQYLSSLFWGLAGISGLGVREEPSTTAQYIFTVAVFLVGLMARAHLIAHVGVLLLELDPTEAEQNKRRASVLRELEHAPAELEPEVRAALTKRIAAYFDFVWGAQQGVMMESVLGETHPRVRKLVSAHVGSAMVRKVPLLSGFDEAAFAEISSKLVVRGYPQGEFLMHKVRAPRGRASADRVCAPRAAAR